MAGGGEDQVRMRGMETGGTIDARLTQMDTIGLDLQRKGVILADQQGQTVVTRNFT